MMIATNPELRRLKNEAHAERSNVLRHMFADLFTWTAKAPKGAQTA